MKIGLGYIGSGIAGIIICAAAIILSGCDGETPPPPDYPADNTLNAVYPRNIAENSELPVVLNDGNVNPRQAVWALYNLSGVESGMEADFNVKRGLGSITIADFQSREYRIYSSSSPAVPLIAFNINIKPRAQMRELTGVLTPEDLNWDSTQIVYLEGDITIPAGNTLTVECGTIVICENLVSINAIGNVEFNGTAEYPIYFTSADTGSPWGELFHQNSNGHYRYVFFTNGGGDLSKPFGHSHSQPVLSGNNCNLLLNHVYIIDNPGKALGLTSSVISMDSCLISRCDTGGELMSTLAIIDNCYFLDMPDGSDVEVDDDNDALYLLNSWNQGPDSTVISNCVFASGKDDGIDHNGAILKIDRCIIEDFDNEGVAASDHNGVLIYNTLITGCEQGIEAGYGSPQVVVEHCLLYGNQTGLRFGDWRDWGCTGSLYAENTISFDNSLHNVWNFDVLLNAPREGALNIGYCLVNQAGYDTSEGCVTGTPIYDSEYELVPGSPGYNAGSDGTSMGLLP